MENNKIDSYYLEKNTDEISEYKKIHIMNDLHININLMCIWENDIVENDSFDNINKFALSCNLRQKLSKCMYPKLRGFQ